MKQKRENLPGKAKVKGTMLQAHIEWAEKKRPGCRQQVADRVSEESKGYASGSLLVTDWIPFKALIDIDRAIAEALGGLPDDTYRALGHNSASANLAGVYKSFVADEPHRFFDRGARLHDRFQDFGKAEYQVLGDRSGRMRITGYSEYSPVYCASAIGYYKGCLETMKVPGPIRVLETECQCQGDAACVFDLNW